MGERGVWQALAATELMEVVLQLTLVACVRCVGMLGCWVGGKGTIRHPIPPPSRVRMVHGVGGCAGEREGEAAEVDASRVEREIWGAESLSI